jgi:hypothetical protein
MKIISLETNLTLDGMAIVYHELKNKQTVKGDLIQKNKNNLGVIIDKDNFSIYMGSFDEKEDILITEFNSGTFAQFYSVKGSEAYPNYKNIIETACREASK